MMFSGEDVYQQFQSLWSGIISLRTWFAAIIAVEKFLAFISFNHISINLLCIIVSSKFVLSFSCPVLVFSSFCSSIISLLIYLLTLFRPVTASHMSRHFFVLSVSSPVSIIVQFIMCCLSLLSRFLSCHLMLCLSFCPLSTKFETYNILFTLYSLYVCENLLYFLCHF